MYFKIEKSRGICMTKIVNIKSQQRKVYRRKLSYVVLTVVLSLCLMQFLYSIAYNFTRFIVLNGQIDRLEKLYQASNERNNDLRAQLKVYSSYKGIEELARNNLKMVGKDEVLVLIRNAPSELKPNNELRN
jgi:cell division protein FtsB